ncbi:helix-turn-helix transcriptional regulator [Alcanivorax sp.]|uniref:helix-turn-helix transcriptional regulator n=1 Tax=Alcanivorax sp. TaxID=1872427 RepID=UPI0026318DED|nr:helix-turn-helix transcriptional regulator [Alcanivorax sp.]
MTNQKDLISFIGEIYEASYRPEHWQYVFEQLCQRLEAKGGGIHVEDYSEGTRYILASHGIPKLGVLAYQAGMGKHDVVFQIQASRPVGKAAQVVTPEQLKASHPLSYRFIQKPQDIGYVAAIGLFNNEQWHAGIGLHRSFKAQPFGSDELGLLDALFPHFQRALHIHRTLHRSQRREASLRLALSEVMVGILVLNTENRVTYCNPMAEQLLSHHPALQLIEDRLYTHSSDEAATLWQTVNAMRQAMAEEDASYSQRQALGLHHPAYPHPLTVIVANPEKTDNNPPPGNGHIILYIYNPGADVSCTEEDLMTQFRLTRSEAGVAIALVNGLSLEEISTQKGVGKETIRSHLKGVFMKMGVKKQQEVIRLVLNSRLGHLPNPESEKYQIGNEA